jgi:ABC-type branched-subunit amino acid transport system substrate-binding protein
MADELTSGDSREDKSPHTPPTADAPEGKRAFPGAQTSKLSLSRYLVGINWREALLFLVLGIVGTIASKYFIDNHYDRLLRAAGLDAVDQAIAVVLPSTGGDAKAADEMIKAINQAKSDHCRGASSSKLACKIKINFEDDLGVPDEATRIAKKLRESSREVIGVIGHFSSSTTERALGEYCTGQTLPIVMPVITATSIVDTARSIGCTAVLRLPPTNQQQGSEAAKLLGRMPNKTDQKKTERVVGLMRDQSNPVYSNDYGRAFLDALRRRHQAVEKYYHVMFNVAVGGETAGLPITSGMAQLEDIDVVLIIGMTDLVLQSLRQAKSVKWEPGSVIITDGAVSEALVTEGEGVLAENVYLVFPLPKEKRVPLQALHETIGLQAQSISFAGYGYDSALLMLMAIDELEKARKKINREELSTVIRSWTENRTEIVGKFSIVSSYTFDKTGNNAHPALGLYQYVPDNKRFEPVRFD